MVELAEYSEVRHRLVYRVLFQLLLKDMPDMLETKVHLLRVLPRLSYQDPTITEQLVDLYLSVIHHSSDLNTLNGTIEGLSKIARFHQEYQNTIISLFHSLYDDPNTPLSLKGHIVIGFGRIAQCNEQIREEWKDTWFSLCSDLQPQSKISGLRGLGYSLMTFGEVLNDEEYDKRCLDIALSLLKDGGNMKFRDLFVQRDSSKYQEISPLVSIQKVYEVQMAAVHTIGCLFISNPKKWAERVLPTMNELLTSPLTNILVKQKILAFYAKISFFVDSSGLFYNYLKDIYLKFMKNKELKFHANEALCKTAGNASELIRFAKVLLLEHADLSFEKNLADISVEDLINGDRYKYLKCYIRLIIRKRVNTTFLCHRHVSPQTKEINAAVPPTVITKEALLEICKSFPPLIFEIILALKEIQDAGNTNIRNRLALLIGVTQSY
eukprot:TRINITY_DN15618_c0_g1_i1.p1 TRINITY_DN15618_c0_g1~~TRINITY_DN15618_c0_g1_i1.p1  ORF type:complete len:479 (-),score=120.82 TRINITY_DN15618_c0_g1_i1:422-1735(-)